MKSYIKYTALGALLLTMAGGCSDTDDWKPGEADTATGVSAYFNLPSQLSYVFDKEGKPEDMNVEVTLNRKVTAEAVSIPLTLTSDAEGFTLPATADFAAGEATTTFKVNCSGIEEGKRISFTVGLPADQTNIYGEGMDAVTYNVIKSEWTLISNQVRYIYSYTDYSPMYSETYGKMYHLQGTYNFKMTDFFGSGLDMQFECNTPDQTAFVPTVNADFDAVSDGDKEIAGWYLYNEAEETWPEWTPGDEDGKPAITYVEFYALVNYSWMTMIYTKEPLYGYVGFSTGVGFDNGDFSWGAWQADFTLNYNPFESN